MWRDFRALLRCNLGVLVCGAVAGSECPASVNQFALRCPERIAPPGACIQVLCVAAMNWEARMFLMVLGALLVLGGLLYMARTAIWRGPLSGPDSSGPVRDTLEPPRRSVRFLGLGTNWPGILLMAIGAVLLVSGAGF